MRLIFTDNLHNILKDIYHLVNKVGFNASDVEKMPPVERDMYLIYYKEEKEKEKRAREGNNNTVPMMGAAMSTDPAIGGQ